MMRSPRTSAFALRFAGLWLLSTAVWAQPEFQLRVLSSRADAVSGGSALVELAGAPDGKLQVRLNGLDISSAFRRGPAGRGLLARVEPVKPGRNVLEARSGGKRARLEIAGHSAAGPVFSGRHQSPFLCQPEASGLGPALDSDCTAKMQVTYYYRSTIPPNAPGANATPDPNAPPPGFKIYDPSAPPADLADTKTTEGKTVKFIVRRERGTINRAIYEIVFLHEPGQPLPNPWSRGSSGWNGRLVFSFGGGCGAAYRQGRLLGGFDGGTVGQGFAFATSSLNILYNDCNDVISAETLSMVKEYFIKQYGVPLHTIGVGGSGGSIQQQLIAQNYPGLLDGIIPSASYPDIISLLEPVLDCALLAHAFDGAKQPWPEEQKTAVSGFATWQTCGSWMKFFSPALIDPKHCDASIPANLVFDPVSNPKGVRCTVQDNQVNIYGTDAKTGYARRPVDNVGVQYGLAAFQSGKISAEQFVELNERVGGYDADAGIVANRTVADPEALRIAYRTGRVDSGAGSLGSIPIIDNRVYSDTKADIHDRVRSFEMRARLIQTNGRADNQVMFVNARVNPVLLMDEWLTNIGKDQSQDGGASKVARNKPQGVEDACWTADGQRIAEPASYDGRGRCNEMYPAHADPRIVAGAPLTNDVLKCVLKPVDAADYLQPLTEGQLARLKAVFPGGVCDYRRPGVGQELKAQPWLTFR